MDRVERDANAGIDPDGDAFQREGIVQHVSHTSSNRYCALGVHVHHEDRELVTAKAGELVLLADAVLETSSNVAEQIIASVVAEAVVDLFESVKVEQQERAVVLVALSVPEGYLHLFVERTAVGKAGQLVGKCKLPTVSQAICLAERHNKSQQCKHNRASCEEDRHRVQVAVVVVYEKPESDERRKNWDTEKYPRRQTYTGGTLGPPRCETNK